MSGEVEKLLTEIRNTEPKPKFLFEILSHSHPLFESDSFSTPSIKVEDSLSYDFEYVFEVKVVN